MGHVQRGYSKWRRVVIMACVCVSSANAQSNLAQDEVPLSRSELVDAVKHAADLRDDYRIVIEQAFAEGHPHAEPHLFQTTRIATSDGRFRKSHVLPNRNDERVIYELSV